MDWLAASQRSNRAHISVVSWKGFSALRLWHDGAPGGCLPWCPELPGCQQLSIHRRCREGKHVGPFHGQQCQSWISVGGPMDVSRYAICKVQHFQNQASAPRFPNPSQLIGSKKHPKKPSASYFRKHPRRHSLIPPWEVMRVGMSHGPSQCCGLEPRNAGDEVNDPKMKRQLQVPISIIKADMPHTIKHRKWMMQCFCKCSCCNIWYEFITGHPPMPKRVGASAAGRSRSSKATSTLQQVVFEVEGFATLYNLI